jgi:hypothetical protein
MTGSHLSNGTNDEINGTSDFMGTGNGLMHHFNNTDGMFNGSGNPHVMFNGTHGGPPGMMGLLHEFIMGGDDNATRNHESNWKNGPPGNGWYHQIGNLFQDIFPGENVDNQNRSRPGPGMMMGWDMGLVDPHDNHSGHPNETDPASIWLHGGVQMMGGGNPMDPMEDHTWVNLTCPVNTGQPTFAAMGHGGMVTSGTWICRTLFDPQTGTNTTRSACIDASHDAWDTDTCGCRL